MKHKSSRIKELKKKRVIGTNQSKSKQANEDIWVSAQPQVSMAGKYEPQYSGEPKHYMNMSHYNNKQVSEI